ncbi:hypothetical protein MXB_1318 [Myxobolus squamalis]|nr:hypothetical protein MXB_1318 [Myxobolus squamalis]
MPALFLQCLITTVYNLTTIKYLLTFWQSLVELPAFGLLIIADAFIIFIGYKFRCCSKYKASVYYIYAKIKSKGCKTSLVVQRDNIYTRKSEHVCYGAAVIHIENKKIQKYTQSILQWYTKDCCMNDADVCRHIISELKERFKR